jgi:hypothetical protein
MSFGPGVLQIGATGSEIDASCLVNGLRIEPSVDRADSTKKLCGQERPGVATYTALLTGNVDNDSDQAESLFQLSWEFAGSIQPFIFTPNEELGPTATGQLTIDPMAFGADAFGDDMASDISWSIFGDITMTPVVGTAYVLKLGAVAPTEGTGAPAATGATAGTPGTWTPAGSAPPADVASIGSVVASPATAWTTGEYVQTGTAGSAGQAHWDGSAWVAGVAP